MSSIDQRVVEMKFDNAAFAQGVKNTQDQLKSLKDSLKLDGATKGLEDVEAAAKGFTLGSIGTAVEGIASKFSAMSIIGITALTNITNKAINAGEQMAKSLTLSPIKAGFDEYELKMGSIQTILSNTARYGTQLPEVTANLDQLNTYADKTIYNFGDMTKNIGLFTNAGIKIGDATSMIKGFSNEAAASGTNAEGASSAAYQLSQALSAGKVTLMDWRSLQNVGMGNKNMQSGIIELATAMGTFKGTGTDATKATKDFNGSLEKGWLKADVMSNYLKIMAGDMDTAKMKSLGLSDATIKTFTAQQKMSEDAATKVRTWTQLIGTVKESIGSGWTDTFGILFGDFNEATDLFTNINNVISTFVGNSANARNKVLGDWKALGGRTALIDGIKLTFQALFAILKPIKDAFRQIFPAKTGQDLMEMTKAFHTFAENLLISGSTADKIKRTFAGVFAVLDIGWQIVKRVATVFIDLFSSAGKGGSGILDITAKIGDFLVQLDEAVANGSAFSNFFKNLTEILKKPIALISEFAGWLGGLFKGLNFDGTAEKINKVGDALNPLSGIGDKLSTAWNAVVAVLGKVWDAFLPLGQKLADSAGKLGSIFSNMFGNIDYANVLRTIDTALFGGIVLLLKKFLSNFGKGGQNDRPSIFDSIKETLEGVTNTLTSMQNALKAGTLLAIAAALGLLVIAVVALSKIDSESLKKALVAITIMFVQLGAALKAFEKIGTTGSMAKLILTGAALILIAAAIDILAGAVKKLSDMKFGDLMRGLVGLGIILKMLSSTVESMSGNNAKMVSTAAGLVILAVAIKLLVGAVQDLSNMSWEEMSKGLVGVGVLLGALALFTNFAKADKVSLSSGAGILLMAAAIKVLASGVKDMADMDWATMGRGLAGTAGGLVVIAAAMKLMPESSIGKAAGILIVAASLKLIGMALSDVGKMDWNSIAKGAVGLGVVLAAIALALTLIPKGAILSAASIAIVAGSLLIVGQVLQTLGSMSWEEIAKGMVAMGGSLLAISLSMMAMEGALPGALALVVVAGAMLMLVPVLLALGAMSWESIAKGLVGLAGAIVILGAGTIVLGLLSPLILALGVAVVVLGAGMALAGVGILAFSTGLIALSAAGAVGTAAIVAIVSGLISLIPAVAVAIGEGVIAFAKVIATAGPAILAAITAVLMAFLQAIIDVTPKVAETLMTLLATGLAVLVAAVPMMVTAGMAIINGLLDGVQQNIGQIVDKAADIITKFINGLAKNLPQIIQAGVNLILAFVNGLAKAIRDNSTAMGEAGGNLASALVEGMAKGIAGGAGKIVSAAKDMAKSAFNAAKDFLNINSPSKKFIELGSATGEGMVVGINGGNKAVADAATGLGLGALDATKKSLDINSPSKEFEKVGSFVVDGFALGLTGNKDKIVKAADDMANDLKAAMDASAKDAQDAGDKIAQLTQKRNDDNAAIQQATLDLNDAMKAKKKNANTIRDDQDRIRKLTQTRDADNQAIQDAIAAQAAANAENAKASAGYKYVTDTMSANLLQLEALADGYDDLTKQIDDANKKLDDAKKVRDDYSKSVADQYDALPDIGDGVAFSDFLSNLQTQIDSTKILTGDLAQLSDLGLNDEMYKTLVGKGTAGIPFIEQMLASGQDGVDQLNALQGQLDALAGTLGTAASTELYQAGVDSAQGLVNGLQANQDAIHAQMVGIADGMTQALKDQLGIHSPSTEMAALGDYSAQGLVQGLSNASTTVSQAASALGGQVISGMVAGLSAGIPSVTAAAEGVAQAALAAAMAELGIASPSKEFIKIGQFSSEGMANGLKNYSGMVETAASGVGSDAIHAMRKSISGIGDLISGDVDLNPVITPVLDLSSVSTDVARMSSMVAAPISVEAAYSSAVSASRGYRQNQEAVNTETVPPAPISNTFNQYNNSPKALSSATIYRQTKNQLSVAKGKGALTGSAN